MYFLLNIRLLECVSVDWSGRRRLQRKPSRRTAFATKSQALGAVAVKFLQRAQKLLQIEPYAVRLAEAMPAESVRLERKSTLFGF